MPGGAKNELKMAEAMYDNAEELLRAAGAEVIPFERRVPPPPGRCDARSWHPRVWATIKKSVVNRFSQAHDVVNLFVADGASFVSNRRKNCTLSIIAIAWRACDYLAEELRRGNL